MTVRNGSKFGDTFPFTLAQTFEETCNRIFMRRFPIEPLTAEFEPSAYNVNSSGAFPRYRAKVFNRFNRRVTEDYNTIIPDVFVVDGMYNDDSILLNRNDGKVIDIDLSPVTGWYQGD